MALLDAQYPVREDRSHASVFHDGQYSPAQLTGTIGGGGNTRVNVRGDMPTPLSSSASSGSIAPQQAASSAGGLHTSSSTAELVALGLISTAGATDDNTAPSKVVDSSEYNSSDVGGYDPRSSVPPSSSIGSAGMVGSTNGGTAGLEATAGGGGHNSANGSDISGGVVTSSAATGPTGGVGLGLRNHSLTNLANMARSQSSSSFHSDLFVSGAGSRMTAHDAPSWGSYPANLDKAGGSSSAHAFTLSPATGPIGGGGSSGGSTGAGDTSGRATSTLRSPAAGGDGSADISSSHFAARGTAPRREIERGLPSWASSVRSSQRRLVGSSVDHGGMPAGRTGGSAQSGRAMVHNRSDTDLVASFSRLGFGHSGVSRWSPHMSPTASPLGAPLLEEDPLDLELDESVHEAAGGDTFGTGSSPRGQVRRGGLNTGGVSGVGGRLPRHASYPSLTLSHGSYGVEDLVQGAFEDLNVGDNATAPGGEVAGSGSAANGVAGTLSASGMSSGGLSSGARANGRVTSGGVTTGSSSGGVGSVTGATSNALSTTGTRGASGYSPGTGTGSSTTLSPAHSHSSGASAQRPPQGLRQTAPDGGRPSSQSSRHRPSHSAHAGSPSGVSGSGGNSSGSGGSAGSTGGAAAHGHRSNSHAYDHGLSGIAGVDGVMMSDGRFVPSSAMYHDGPPILYGDSYGTGGYENVTGSAGTHGMDIPWHVSQDPVSLYQALLMKQSLAAAHASGMRFPNMLPVANGMGVNMMDMATIAAAAQAAAGGRGAYGGGGGGYGGHIGGGLEGHLPGGYGRREATPMRGSPTTRGGMGTMEVGGYVNHLGAMGDGRGGGMVGIGRGGMYDIMEDVGDGNVYQVQFKRSTRNFLLGKTCQRDLQVGDYVKVEADRGEDLGMVVHIFPMPEAGRPLPATAGQKRGFGQFEKEHIIRAASDEEVQMVKDKLRDEERVLEVCRTKVLQRSLPMRVMDAEFQYDRHKLTFFFEAEGRIDFRELVRDLFSLYKTRIWMQQLEPETTPSGGTMPSPYSPQVTPHIVDTQASGPMGMGMGGSML